MDGRLLIFLSLALCACLAFPAQKEDPVDDKESVFVQSEEAGARPVARKEKVEGGRPFETAHKIPPKLTYTLEDDCDEDKDEGLVSKKVTKKNNHKKVIRKRAAQGAAPLPAGAIKLDVKKLLAQYKTELKVSTTTTKKPKTEASTKSSRKRGPKRVKKEAKLEDVVATSPSPVLTTGKSAPRAIDDDIPLLTAASEKQRSRIQIKKGPNGQEYEYEYVYYYYDDDEDPKDKKAAGHDASSRNQIARGDKNLGKATPEANEVVPSRGTKSRGRQLGEEENVSEERLPANTRFPPRSRNLNTTPIPEEETKAASRGRTRGRPTTESTATSEADNVSVESQATRGRTRANVRRPSLDLVDNDSFNNGGQPSNKPQFPQELPKGPNGDKQDQTPQEHKASTSEDEASGSSTEEATTVMSAMDKVALDLYAISQGTQKLFGEEGSDVAEDGKSVTDTQDATTAESDTEPTEAETTSTTTTTTTTSTTTTTTTPAPTTTTTTEAPAPGRAKFGGRRGGIGRKSGHTTTTTTTTEAAPEPKRGKFGRPSFGGRSRARTTPAPAAEEEVKKEESKPVSGKSTTRSRFGSGRPRGRTTPAPEEHKEETSTTSTAPHRPSKTRPSLLRPRGRTTAAPSTTHSDEAGDESSGSTAETASTTAKPRRIGAGSAVRPLRPGPRLNLAGRGRTSAATSTTTTEAPADDHVTGDEDSNENSDKEAEKEEEPAPVDNSPLSKLRNKNRPQIGGGPRQKAAASAPVQVRRVNPLIGRRRPGQTTEAAPSSSEAPAPSVAAEEAETAEETATEEIASSSTTTTEEPKGLNKLLAGRRRLGARTPGTLG